MESIGDIKAKIAATEDTLLPKIIEIYSGDDRSGVVKLVEAARKRYDKYRAEKQRIYELMRLEEVLLPVLLLPARLYFPRTVRSYILTIPRNCPKK